jgi:hypothetical protein
MAPPIGFYRVAWGRPHQMAAGEGSDCAQKLYIDSFGIRGGNALKMVDLLGSTMACQNRPILVPRVGSLLLLNMSISR